MNRQTAERMLSDALNPNEQIRSRAEEAIKTFMKSNYSEYLVTLSQIMLDSQKLPIQIRQISSIILKNTFHSKNPQIQKGLESSWSRLPGSFRKEFLSSLHGGLLSGTPPILDNIAKIIGSIIRIDCCTGPSEPHFRGLRDAMAHPKHAYGMLIAVSTACDQLYEETDYQFTDDLTDILFISTLFLNNANTDKSLQMATLSCLFSVVDLLGPLFREESVKQEFLRRLTEYAAFGEDVTERVLGILNRFATMAEICSQTDLFRLHGFFIPFLDSASEPVRLQALDFLEIVAESKSDSFLKENFGLLLPKLFSFLTKEDADVTEWTEHKAASAVLSIITRKWGREVLRSQVAREFIIEELRSSDSETRAVGAIALGSISAAGSSDFLTQSLPILIGDLGHDVSKNEALFAIARICEVDIQSTLDCLPNIIEKCGILISNSSAASANAIWAYHAIFAAAREQRLPAVSSIISFHFVEMLGLLVNKLSTLRPSDFFLRNAVNSALSELIPCCPPKQMAVLSNLSSFLTSRIMEILGSAARTGQLSSNDHVVFEDILSNYTVVLSAALDTMADFDQQAVFGTFTAILSSPSNKSHGEVYIAVSSLLPRMGGCEEAFIQYIVRDLSASDAFIFQSALNCLSDIAIYMESRFTPHMNSVFHALTDSIVSANLSPESKALVIEAFGHVALAVGEDFLPCVNMALAIFKQVNTFDRGLDEEYADQLRRTVVKLFNCIVVSVGPSREMRDMIVEAMPLVQAAAEQDVEFRYTRELVDLLYDIRQVHGADALKGDWIRRFVHDVSSSASDAAVTQKARKVFYDLR